MNNIFSSIKGRRPKSSSFNLTHSRKFSFAPGYCYPILCQETLPSDKWSHDVSALIRFQPLRSPMMHLVDVYSYSFRVPMRLLMARSKWEVFITGGTKGDGKDAQGNYIEIPFARFSRVGVGEINPDAFMPGTLLDYLGVSAGDTTGNGTIRLNMMPLIAYWRVWCEYFRDQNLHPNYVELFPGVFEATGDITAALNAAQNDATNPWQWYLIPHVCWEKDYFASGLPFAQRGEPVETPLSGSGDVSYREFTRMTPAGGGTMPAGSTHVMSTGDGGSGYGNTFLSDDGASNDGSANVDNVEDVQLETGGFTINALRLAARLQEWLEKMARGGARYIEQIRSHFGVTSSDARLQRAEYLGGGKIPVNISEVLSTYQSGEDTGYPQGNMAGHGISAGKVTGWSSHFEEHCILISVMFMRPRTAYQQGIPRLFTHRFDKLDYAWPSFAHLGEQEIKMSELYATMNDMENDEDFAYQQRYAEYKYIPSTVHGDFKTSLNFWHWGRVFESRPTLSKEFVECDPSPRVFNVIETESDPLYCIVNNRINCVRPLPYYGEPSL